jgi:DUF1016 N-terminal domain
MLRERLSYDLRDAFPEMKGFSPRDLQFTRTFAELYLDGGIVKQAVSQFPWGHIIILMQKVKVPVQRDWYINQSILNGWMRNILALQISSQSYEREGKALRLLCHRLIQIWLCKLLKILIFLIFWGLLILIVSEKLNKCCDID